jgi:hypothetical protein
MHGLIKRALPSLLLFGACSTWAEKGAPEVPPNLMPCNEVLKFPSLEFVKKYTQVHGQNTLETTNAIYQYSNCYDQALDSLRDKLNQQGSGPLMGATGQFRDFEMALNKFTTTALDLCSPEPSLKRVSDAYATLYQKQFRHQFYEHYLPKSHVSPANPQAISAAKAKVDSLINHLPPQQAPPVRAAFDAYYQAAVTGLALSPLPVYQYAIMLMQSPAEKPYSVPPF